MKLFWIRTVMAVTIPIPWLFMYFTLHFPVSPRKNKPNGRLGILHSIMPVLGVWTMLLVAISYTPVMFSSLWLVEGYPHLSAGIGVAAYGSTFLAFSIVATWLLFKTYIWQTGLARLQSAYILLGLSLTIIFGFFANFVFVTVFQNFDFVAIGPASSLFLISAMSYAMLKHRLLDLKLAVLRFVVYVSTLLVMTLAYSTVMSELQQRLVNYLPSFPRQISTAVSIAVALLCFPVLLRKVQQRTQQLFYKSLFQPERAHQILSQIISNSVTSDKLQQEIDRFFCTELGVEWSGIVTCHEEDSQLDEVLSHFFLSGEAILVFDELDEATLKGLLRQKNIQLVIPISLHHHPKGWVYLGPKHSGNAFSCEQLKFLEVVGPQLALAIDHLDQVDRIKEDFVSIASHELRTPMTAIKSYLWLCLFKPSLVLPDNVKHHLQTAYSATERLLDLVRDLLTLSQIEADQLPLKRRPVRLLDLAKCSVLELESLATSKHIHFQINESAVDTSCVVDETKISEVLNNLLGNAIKFSPDSGAIEISLDGSEQYVTISIRDQGPGISAADQERLFQKFGIIQSSYRKSPDSGTGLGLYISQQFAKLHKGLISVSSILGQGSTFTLSLPREQLSLASVASGNRYAKNLVPPSY